MESISNNDQKYFAWLESHGDGFVVNTYSKPSASYMVLHRATCYHIQRWTGRTSTCGSYLKVVTDDVSELHAWAAGLGGTLTACRTCQP